MDSKRPVKGSLVNKNTRFSKFKWGEDPEIKRAIQELKDKFLLRK